jgi:hypothetical protein
VRHAAHDYRRRRFLVRAVRPETMGLSLDEVRASVGRDWRSLFDEDDELRALEEAGDVPVG